MAMEGGWGRGERANSHTAAIHLQKEDCALSSKLPVVMAMEGAWGRGERANSHTAAIHLQKEDCALSSKLPVVMAMEGGWGRGERANSHTAATNLQRPTQVPGSSPGGNAHFAWIKQGGETGNDHPQARLSQKGNGQTPKRIDGEAN